MNKLALFRISLFILMAGLLAMDGILMLARHTYHLPEEHKDLILTGFLLWFIMIIVGQESNDDDWAELF